MSALTAGHGVDAAIDIAATSETLDACLKSLAPGRRLVVIDSRSNQVFGPHPILTVDVQEMHAPQYVNNEEIPASTRMGETHSDQGSDRTHLQALMNSKRPTSCYEATRSRAPRPW